MLANALKDMAEKHLPKVKEILKVREMRRRRQLCAACCTCATTLDSQHAFCLFATRNSAHSPCSALRNRK